MNYDRTTRTDRLDPSVATSASGQSAGSERVESSTESSPDTAAQADGGEKQEAIRVLIADDHKIVREGLVYSLESYPNLELVGAAEDGEQALEMVRQHHPDVVVMDVSMPVLDGIEATRRLRREAPEVKVIGLSMHDSEEIRHALLSAGASEYLTKNGAMEELIAAIRRSFAS